MYEPHPLFASDWYSSQYPEVAASGLDPFAHYLRHGDAAGRAPHPLFDPDYYSSQYPEVAAEGGARLAHYVEVGSRSGASPHRLFDGAWYLAQNPEIASTGEAGLVHYLRTGEVQGREPNPLFDPRHYGITLPDRGGCGSWLEHYVRFGIDEGRAPSMLFFAVWYTQTHPEVDGSGLDPISHYRIIGDAEELWPNPLFDPGLYGAQHPDVPRTGGERLAHYARHGGHNRSDPHALFSSRWYLESNGIELEEHDTPLGHYLREGDAANLNPHPLFDPRHYSMQIPGIPAAGGARLAHFLARGGSDGASPHQVFDSSWYLEQHPELAKTGQNPLVHFVWEGEAENAQPNPLFDPHWYADAVVERSGVPTPASPTCHYVLEGDAADAWPSPLFDPLYYSEQFPEIPKGNAARLAHYLTRSTQLRANPHRLFDTAFYLDDCSKGEGRAEGIGNDESAVAHYLRVGEEQGCRPNPLFDPSYYASGVRDRAGCRSWLEHYLCHGVAEGRSPHLLFDPAWYLESNPKAARSNLDPISHYLSDGDEAGSWPHPLFDPFHYSQQFPELPHSGGARLAHFLERGNELRAHPHWLFDTVFYLDHLARGGKGESADRDDDRDDLEPGETALAHYIRVGEALGYRPNALFDPAYYRRSNPDLRGRTSLLCHYAQSGESETRKPCALLDPVYYASQCSDPRRALLTPINHYVSVGDAEDAWPHPLFDPDFYSEQNPDLPRSNGARLGHYLEHGGRAGSDPHPLFDTAHYLAQLPELAESDENPLVHYLEEGEHAGRRPCLLFDPAYYRRRNPGVERGGLPLLAHYHEQGFAAGLKAHPAFDARWYRGRHPELDPLRADALAHYLRCGIAAGERPHPLFEVPRGSGAEFEIAPHALFDSDWYRDFYALDDDEEPILHYLHAEPQEERQPGPLFNPRYYVERYRVALAPGETALGHFVGEGIEAGHRPGPLFDFCIRFFRERDKALRRPEVNPLGAFLADSMADYSCAEREIGVELAPSEAPEVSIIIAGFGPVAYTLACLRSLGEAETRSSYEVIVVDDGIDDAERLDGIPNLRIVRNDSNLGFLRSCNHAAESARGRYLCFLNNDTLVTAGWLDALVDTFADIPGTGVVGSRLMHPNGMLQEAGGVVFRDGNAMNYGWGEPGWSFEAASSPGGDAGFPLCRDDDLRFSFARKADYVSAASLLVPRELFAKLGGFDEAYAPAFYEDTDLCFRVREEGLDVRYQPLSTVVHFGGASHGRNPERGLKRHQERNRHVFAERHARALAAHGSSLDSVDGVAREVRRHERGSVLVMDTSMITPDMDSGSLRMFNLLRILRDLDFGVTFHPVDLDLRERYGRALQRIGVRVAAAPSIESTERFLEASGSEFDLCILSRPAVGGAWIERVRLLCPRAVVLYDTVDLHFLRRERELRLLGSSQLGLADVEQEMRSSRRADGVLVVSEYDKDRLQQAQPGLDVHVLSNIHEIHRTDAPFESRSGILFIGGFSHAPNIDGVQWFVRDVLPLIHEELPDLDFHVIGSEMPEEVRALASDHVLIEGYVEDVAPFFASCRLSVAPLRYGSGVKGKVNQSMAYGVPCVATSIAAEGMEAKDGSEIAIADDARDFAARVIELHRDAELWRGLAANSLRSVERTFGVAMAEEKLRGILAKFGVR